MYSQCVRLLKQCLSTLSSKLSFVCGALLGFLGFLLLWGSTPLDTTNFSWLTHPFGGDLTFSTIAALAYQKEPWTFPIGAIDTIVYPARTSIVFADNVPLMAILFKVLAKILGRDIQYYGIWGCLCFSLQGGISAAILNKYYKNILLSLIGSVFFLLTPFLLWRMFGHISMSGQWVVLLGLLLVAYRQHPFIRRHDVSLWVGLSVISVGVLAYFLPMVMALSALYFWLQAGENAGVAIRKFSIMFINSVLACLAFLWVSGGLLGGMTSGGAGYGEIPFNLASFIDSHGFSRIFKPLPVEPNERFHWESYAWLGLGLIIASLFAIGAFLKDGRMPQDFFSQTFPYIAVSFFILAFAATNTVRLGDVVLFSYSLPSTVVEAFSTFRSSARLAWPVWYLIAFAALGYISRFSLGSIGKATLLVGLLTIQVWDGFAMLKMLKNPDAVATPAKLHSNLWSNLNRAGDHLNIIPFWGELQHEALGEIYFEAVKAGVSTNIFWLGRYPMDAMNANINRKVDLLRQTTRLDGDILVFNHAQFLHGAKLHSSSQAYLADGLIIVAKPDLDNLIPGLEKVSLSHVPLVDYLAKLTNLPPHQVVMMAARESPSSTLVIPTISRSLNQLGLRKHDAAKGNFAYAAVLTSGQVIFEASQATPIRHTIRVDSDASVLPASESQSVAEFGLNIVPGRGPDIGLTVNGINALGAVFGLNIVIYDFRQRKVVEQASFAAFADEDGVIASVDH